MQPVLLLREARKNEKKILIKIYEKANIFCWDSYIILLHSEP